MTTPSAGWTCWSINAGILIDAASTILELPLGLLQNTLTTNAFGPLLLSQGCVPIMGRHKYGRIVNISSTLGTLTDIGNPQAPVSPEQAAETLVWLVALPDDGPNGGFFHEHQSIPW